jgi:xylitol oxidase
MGETNWAGNYTYTAAQVHRPESLDALRSVVAHASNIRVLGTRHSFNDIADAGELISFERLEQAIEIDREAMSVTVGGGVRYGTLAQALVREDLALHAMASLPHISVAGAISTATHGSGDACGNLATAVRALELVTSEGDVVQVHRGDSHFEGMVVGIGALGVVTRVTLDVQPGYLVRQQAFQHLDWGVLFDRFDEVTSSAESVSLFTDFGDTINQVWLKSHVDPDGPAPLLSELFGAIAATERLHPVSHLSAENVTEQLGIPGTWADRLPHFRLDATPSVGDELQTEYLVPRRQAVDALRAVGSLGGVIRPHLQISEIRTVAADDLWLSTAYGRESVAIHFTWNPEPVAVASILPVIEAALEPFEARPHWGKLFAATAGDLESRYERMGEFRQLAARLDPRGAFRNAFFERVIG